MMTHAYYICSLFSHKTLLQSFFLFNKVAPMYMDYKTTMQDPVIEGIHVGGLECS